MRKWIAAITVAGLTAVQPGWASSHPYTDAEVRKVDKEAAKVTLRHGEISNLGMPPMTMVFRVKDPAWLDRFKEGDRIRFRAEKISGAYTVTEVESPAAK